jgi:hypothetical protein
MEEEQVALALRSMRQLRRGNLQPRAAPAVLQPFLADGLGPACDHFASWVQGSVNDARVAETAIRFFGLDGLPQSLHQIGSGLRPRRAGRASGIGARQVEKLVSSALTGMVRSGYSPPSGSGTAAKPSILRDPFPMPHDATIRRCAGQAVAWAWRQVPAGDRTAASALLHYSHEHAMGGSARMPTSRMERLRWRRLAWSMLDVATYRATRSAGARRPLLPEDHPGTDLLAVCSPSSEPEELKALTIVCREPFLLADLELAQLALDMVRTAVREGRPEAPELLWLLRDGMARYREAVGSVPPLLESKVIALSAIVAREQRDPRGVAAAQAGLQRIGQLIDSAWAFRDRDSWIWHVESGYRTSQELADLCTSLGMFAQARAATNIMRRLLRRFGDPDPSYLPYGWHFQLLVTESGASRHLARTSAAAEPWQQAAAIAGRRAADLAAAHEFPASWAVAAETEIIATALDRLADEAYRASQHGRRLLNEVAGQLKDLDSLGQQIDDHQSRDTRRALLHAKLLAWRFAILRADPAAIRVARMQTRQEVQSSAAPILPIEAEAIARYQAASIAPRGTHGVSDADKSLYVAGY